MVPGTGVHCSHGSAVGRDVPGVPGCCKGHGGYCIVGTNGCRLGCNQTRRCICSVLVHSVICILKSCQRIQTCPRMFTTVLIYSGYKAAGRKTAALSRVCMALDHCRLLHESTGISGQSWVTNPSCLDRIALSGKTKKQEQSRSSCDGRKSGDSTLSLDLSHM